MVQARFRETRKVGGGGHCTTSAMGAKTHTVKVNQQYWARHGAKAGFKIAVVTQSTESPCLHCNDLAFFASLQSDADLVTKENVKKLISIVELCWN